MGEKILFDRLLSCLKKGDIAYTENENVAFRSSFKIGGIARLAIFPNTREKLIYTLRLLSEAGVRFEVIGNASNILFAFEYFDGALVFIGGIDERISEGTRIIADCGVSLTRLSNFACEHCLGGFEFAHGIPGVVGGSVYMNAGAHGSQISDVIEYTEAYDIQTGDVQRIYEHGFSYRRSIYMDNPAFVCLCACFALKEENQADIRAKIAANMSARRESQPLEFPSAGSYFKRPSGYFAGKLIEDCGLKGMKQGGAEVSAKHAGFIINRGGATAEDVLVLEEKIKEIVMSRFGVELEREVRLIR